MQEKWEYKIVSGFKQQTLEDFKKNGEEGWELCGVINTPPDGPFFIYYFKRKK